MKPSGNIKSTHDFEPFGVELEPIGNDTTNFNYKYTGQERDTFTNYDYMHFRFYASSIGRFLKPDNIIPDITNPQNWNGYSYVKGNPINFNDPSGHETPDAVQQSVKTETSANLSNPPRSTDNNNEQMKKKLTAQPKKVAVSFGDFNLKADSKLTLIYQQNIALNNPSFQPGYQTHCNQATVFIAKNVRAPLSSLTDNYGKALLANSIAQNLSTSNKYFKVGPILAQALANTGMLVIGAQYNPSGHGHVATVRPEGIPGDKIIGGSSGPLIANVGASVGIKYAGGQNKPAFKRELEVNYYVPATNQ